MGGEYVDRFNDIMLCREFGWTPQDIAGMPEDFYRDAILLLSKESARNNRNNGG